MADGGAPGALRIEGGSVGFQIGGLRDRRHHAGDAKRAGGILSSKFTLGGAADVAAGPVGRSSTAQTDATMNAKILSYSRSRGLRWRRPDGCDAAPGSRSERRDVRQADHQRGHRQQQPEAAGWCRRSACSREISASEEALATSERRLLPALAVATEPVAVEGGPWHRCMVVSTGKSGRACERVVPTTSQLQRGHRGGGKLPDAIGGERLLHAPASHRHRSDRTPPP